MSADIRKTITIVAFLCVCAWLISIDKIDSSAAFGAMCTMVGIVIGNGKNALKGIISAPVLKPKVPVIPEPEEEP